MKLLKTCDEIITLQRCILYTKKNMETARKGLIQQIIRSEEPTYIEDIHRSKTFIIEQSSKIMEFLGFSKLAILRNKARKLRTLAEEYTFCGKGYEKKSMENAVMGGDSVGAEYNFAKPLQIDLIGFNHPILISGNYCKVLSSKYLECAGKSKEELDYTKAEISKRKIKK